MLARLAVFVLLFSHAAFAADEIDSASSHNFGIAASLLGAENSCGFEERPPSADDVFSVAAITAVAIVPQAGNVTSDLSGPKLLWGYSASYPQSAIFPVASEGGCPHGRLEIRNPIGKKLKGGKLFYSYGNQTLHVDLSSNGPNPIALDLNSSYLREEDFASLFANLSVSLSGRVSVDYSYEKYWYSYGCESDGEYIGCGCRAQSEFGVKSYEKAVSGSRLFLVETGPVEEVWLNPPLAKRLGGAEKGELLFFTRRMPAKITAKVDGVKIAESKPYKFSSSIGKCGEKIVSAEFSAEAENAVMNYSNQSIFPAQLVGRNASYLPFYLSFDWNEAAGRKNASIEYEDWFSHAQNFSREVLVREPDAFAVEAEGGGAMALRQGDEYRTPAAYPAKEGIAAPIGLSSLAVMFAIPFAFGAIAIIRWLQKIRP